MKAKWLFALCLFIVSGLACAEGGCPSGMIPYSGTDISSCGPIPPDYYGGDNSSPSPAAQPPVRWADRWGAIVGHAVMAGT